QAKSDTRSATRRQHGAKFCGNARSRLVLKDARLEHVFQECAIRDADRTRPFGEHLWGSPCKTNSHVSAKSKLKVASDSPFVGPANRAPIGWTSISTSPTSATAASVPSNRR